MVDGTSDWDLVSRCLAGDVAAFEPLVRRYERPLYNLAYRVLGDREDARDAVQEAFVRAYEKLGSFDPRYRFFSWIYRIVLNGSINTRSRRRLAAPLAFEPRGGGGQEEAVAGRERRDGLQAALGKLAAADRELLALRHFAELSYAEIAQSLGVPEKTVKSRLHEARQRLGRQLAPGSAQ